MYGMTVYLTLAHLAARPGPLGDTRYAFVVDKGAAYKWIAGSALTADGFNIVDVYGGGIGQWLRVVENDRGADLTNADASIAVFAGCWRVLPVATLTAHRVVAILKDGALPGDIVTITRLDTSAFTLTVRTMIGLVPDDVVMPGGAPMFVDKEYDGVNWVTRRVGSPVTIDVPFGSPVAVGEANADGASVATVHADHVHQSPKLTTRNKNMVAMVTAIDCDKATDTVVAVTPALGSYVQVDVNDVGVDVGDGVKTAKCFFSGDGGATARAIVDIVAGDTMHWVGSVAGWQLAAVDRINEHYLVFDNS
jgi:hypothetical protein